MSMDPNMWPVIVVAGIAGLMIPVMLLLCILRVGGFRPKFRRSSSYVDSFPTNVPVRAPIVRSGDTVSLRPHDLSTSRASSSKESKPVVVIDNEE